MIGRRQVWLFAMVASAAGFCGACGDGSAAGESSGPADADAWPDRQGPSDASPPQTIEDASAAGVPGPEGVLLASGQGQPERIATDADSVYWANYDDGRIMRVSKQGGSPVQLAQASHIRVKYVAVDSTWVYWTDDIPGGGGAVMRVLKTGGTAEVLEKVDSRPFTILIDGKNAYFAGFPAVGTVAIWTFPLAGGTPLVLVPDASGIGSMTIDANFIYWTVVGTGTGISEGAIMRQALVAPYGSVQGPQTLASGQNAPGGLSVDDSAVYWTTAGVQGTVSSVQKAGGNPVVLATMLDSPAMTAVDSTSVPFHGLRLVGGARRADERAQVGGCGHGPRRKPDFSSRYRLG